MSVEGAVVVAGVGAVGVGVGPGGGAALVCVGAAVWVAGGGHGREVRRARELLGSDGGVPWGARAWREGWARWRERWEWWVLVSGAVVAVLGASLVPLVVSAAGVPLAARVRRDREARRVRERRADAVISLCGVLAGEVRAGRQPGEALIVAVREEGETRAGVGGSRAGDGAVVAAARFGGDVPGALREAAREPGAEGMLGLAACWRVAVDRGAGLAAGLERLAGALRAERDQRADLRAQLAGARSTAVMLAGLPVLGLLLGSVLGARPLRVLLHTGAGFGCLLVGGVLEAAGLWWALRIVRGAEER
ncbi:MULTISPECIES: type II secretion system F family protein [unclassified Streptomyces]|uniref:type II secretion system F family protein n=1 Tax=unclassified Streptomyces TaxID=2593676 RepID=UPI00224F8EAD|nr:MULTISPECIES: type II secretion system F family protein [unclassified Streptomyces]MCX5438709.1 type II secretion system F family protein [Streptomyces sp. NBC_00063]WUB94760.1 type II secretion system F family protein [Streptomyces sp. NBC_00569]